MKTRCAVVGHPVSHSLSPVIHRSAYTALGLDWDYQAIDVPPGGMEGFVASLGSQWRGLSVTMPHKADLLQLGEPDELSRLVGAGNTLILPERRVYNTDIPGAEAALRSAGVKAEQAVILGAGSTAKSVLAALARCGVKRVQVQLRNPARAVELAELADRLGVAMVVSPLGNPGETELLVNTLPPKAADPYTELAARAGAVFDVCYDPWPTELVRAAAEKPVVTGLDLLCWQANWQLELMTGHRVDASLLLTAAQTHLSQLARI